MKKETSKVSKVCSRSHEPNRETIEAIENIKKGRNLVRTKNTQDLLKKLGLLKAWTKVAK